MHNGFNNFGRRNRKANWLHGAALGVLAAMTTAPAFADIETVVVTAERRATDAQKTPIPLTVLTGEDLKARNIDALDALQFTTPSLTVQNSGQNVLLNIRGIGKADGGIQVQVGVMTYRDGATAGFNGFIADEPYYDISSVQVLRGPQGTFAGQNATGGAILITEADPTFDGVNGFVEAQYGNYNDVRLQGAINIPITDDFAIRIATDDENRDSFYHISGPAVPFLTSQNPTGNKGNLHMGNLRVSALWQPTDNFSAELKLDGMYNDHGPPIAAPFAGSTKHIFDVSTDTHLMGLDEQFRAVLHMDYKFDSGITLKSISSYQWGVVKFDLDADGTASIYINPINPTDFGPSIFDASARDQVISQEVNLVSPDKGPFTWVLGATWLDDQLFIPRFTISGAPFGTPTFGGALNLSRSFARRDNWGVFGQGIYSLTDDLKVQVGLRYSESLENIDQAENLIINGVHTPNLLVVTTSTRDSSLTGKVDIDWSVDDNNFLYAFVATGHRAAGLNGDGTPFKAEYVADYEAGWKAKFFDGHVQTQLGGYYDNYSNFVMSFFDPLNALGLSGGEDLNVPGNTVLKGIEAQAQAVFGGLSIDMGASYEDSELPTFFAKDARNPAAGVQNLTGRTLPNAPKWTGQIGISYAFDLGNEQTLTPRLDYGFVSSQWGTVFHLDGNPLLPVDRLSARNLLNGQITYDLPNKWQVAVYGTNLTDLHYVATEMLGKLGFPGAPQQFGVRVSKQF